MLDIFQCTQFSQMHSMRVLSTEIRSKWSYFLLSLVQWIAFVQILDFLRFLSWLKHLQWQNLSSLECQDLFILWLAVGTALEGDGQIWREKLRDFKNIFPARGNAASASSGLRPAVSLSAKLWAVWAGKKTATTQLKISQKFAPFGNFIKG